MSISARGGYEYFITFIDDYSRYGYIYLMRQKSEAFEKFKEFKAKVENHRGNCIKSLRSNHKRNGIFPVNQTYLWHLRLCHINLERIHRMVTGGLLSSLDVIALLVYEPYLEEKITMRPFKAKGYRATEVLDLVHTDLCGPMSTSARGGYEYFITFIDYYSRYEYIYLKSEAFDKFKEFKAKVENHRGRSIKSLKSDRGGEYLLGHLGSSSKIMG